MNAHGDVTDARIMRGRMNDMKSYAEPLQIGDVMTGESAGVVVESRSDKFAVGDYVAVHQGWQSAIVADADSPRLMKIDLANGSLSAHLGVVGMPENQRAAAAVRVLLLLPLSIDVPEPDRFSRRYTAHALRPHQKH